MTVRGLGPILAEYAPEAIKDATLKDLHMRSVAIDFLSIIYKYSISIRNSGKDITNASGKSVNHLQAVFSTVLSCIKNGILPVFVSDGKAGHMKRDVIEARKTRQREAERMLNDLDDDDMSPDKIKLLKRSFKPQPHMFHESRILLEFLGIPYVASPDESDPQCAALSASNKSKVYGVISDDWDMLMFGSPYLIRKFSAKADKKFEIVTLKKVLDGLKLTHDQFIDVCILLGTDYNGTTKIKGLAGKRAYEKYIQYGGTMTGLLIGLKKENEASIDKGNLPPFEFPDDYFSQFAKIKAYIKHIKVIKPEEIDVSWKRPQYDKIMEMMCTDNNFSKKIIKKNIDDMIVEYNSLHLIEDNRKYKEKKKQRYNTVPKRIETYGRI